MMTTVRLLGRGDEETLERFLQRHTDTSMFLRSNCRLAGIVNVGKRFQGEYFALFDGDCIVAAAAHFWNGSLHFQAPEGLEDLLQGVVPKLRRPVIWLIGPWEQVAEARRLLGLAKAPSAFDNKEAFFSLPLADLEIPKALAERKVRCRHARDEELDILTEWRVGMNSEIFAMPEDEDLWQASRRQVEGAHETEVLWVLEHDGRIVSTSNFNAVLPDIVQIGGVYTPPALRSKGYARCVVAGSLAEVREKGVKRAVLFTERESAVRAYEAIGFQHVGAFGLVRFDEPQHL
ncbi:MAG: GNAT family N-acetyltransferase [Planctomycetota bacterium]|jgi:N-acetylglutamate synthase-like GNAT family acetyltransferase